MELNQVKLFDTFVAITFVPALVSSLVAKFVIALQAAVPPFLATDARFNERAVPTHMPPFSRKKAVGLIPSKTEGSKMEPLYPRTIPVSSPAIAVPLGMMCNDNSQLVAPRYIESKHIVKRVINRI